MKVKCASCGKPFEAQRSTAKYCSATCRKRGSRSPAKKTEPAKKPAAKKAAAKKATPAKRGSAPEARRRSTNVGSIFEAVKSQLEKHDRLDSVAGQAALELARRMSVPFETGASVASMSKELRATMAEALRGATEKKSTVDELRERRARKQHAG